MKNAFQLHLCESIRQNIDIYFSAKNSWKYRVKWVSVIFLFSITTFTSCEQKMRIGMNWVYLLTLICISIALRHNLCSLILSQRLRICRPRYQIFTPEAKVQIISKVQSTIESFHIDAHLCPIFRNDIIHIREIN